MLDPCFQILRLKERLFISLLRLCFYKRVLCQHLWAGSKSGRSASLSRHAATAPLRYAHGSGSILRKERRACILNGGDRLGPQAALERTQAQTYQGGRARPDCTERVFAGRRRLSKRLACLLSNFRGPLQPGPKCRKQETRAWKGTAARQSFSSRWYYFSFSRPLRQQYRARINLALRAVRWHVAACAEFSALPDVGL